MDRKRINRWTRWFAIIMAAAFALGTVFLGVGSSTGNLFSGCSKSSTPGSLSSSSTFEERVAFFEDQISQNPQDKDSMLALANLYADSSVGRYDDAINYYNQYLVLSPKNPDILTLIGKASMDKGDAEGAIKAYTEVIQVAPTNAFAYFKLGEAAKNSGQNQVAILAWTKYLEINPNDPNAQLIKDEIAKLVALPPVTTEQTTTVPGSPGTSIPLTPTP